MSIPTWYRDAEGFTENVPTTETTTVHDDELTFWQALALAALAALVVVAPVALWLVMR